VQTPRPLRRIALTATATACLMIILIALKPHSGMHSTGSAPGQGPVTTSNARQG
jgi:hypothetical protein